MRIDVHTHAFHPKIAAKVLKQLEDHYGTHPVGTGIIEDLLSRLCKGAFDMAVLLCAATSPGQVRPANRYALQLQQQFPQIIAFGTIHPAFEQWEEELTWLKQAGIRGIKLHPEFQNFWLNDPRLLPIFEHAQDDFIFEIHIGDRKTPEQNPSCPYKLAALLDAFPRLQVIAAHLGGYQQWQHSLKALVGRELWLESSSSMAFINDEELRAIVSGHPRERLLFGSDYPLYDPFEAFCHVQQRTAFSDAEMEALLDNGKKLFC